MGHCHVLNIAAATELLQKSQRLSATSDVFAHEQVAPTWESSWTMFPPISYDLSYIGQVPSMIRPKSLNHIAPGDEARSAAVIKTQRLNPADIKVWLDCLAWAPGGPLSRSNNVATWEDLLDDDRSEAVVTDDRLPPNWMYAARLLY